MLENIKSVDFIEPKKKARGELRLPTLHFIAMDNWVVTIGQQALFAWLQMFTWADRSKPIRDYDVVPNSMRKVAKRLGVGYETYYKKIIAPLWNYGFIDLQEVVIGGNTCVNIIVYEYPQNDFNNSIEPLKKIRDYDTEYSSTARIKKLRTLENKEENKEDMLPAEKQGVTEPVTGVLLAEKQGVTEPVTNNVLNALNVLNSFKDDEEEAHACESIQSFFIKWATKKEIPIELTNEAAALIEKEGIEFNEELFDYVLDKTLPRYIKGKTGAFVPYFVGALKKEGSKQLLVKVQEKREQVASKPPRRSKKRNNVPEYIMLQVERDRIEEEQIEKEQLANKVDPEELRRRILESYESEEKSNSEMIVK